MIVRTPHPPASQRLLDLIERRFGVRLTAGSTEHLREVAQHYQDRRALLRMQFGATDVLRQADYAKAVLISEAARLLLREIDPWPRRRKTKGRRNAR